MNKNNIIDNGEYHISRNKIKEMCIMPIPSILIPVIFHNKSDKRKPNDRYSNTTLEGSARRI